MDQDSERKLLFMRDRQLLGILPHDVFLRVVALPGDGVGGFPTGRMRHFHFPLHPAHNRPVPAKAVLNAQELIFSFFNASGSGVFIPVVPAFRPAFIAATISVCEVPQIWDPTATSQ
jgi:hypothetical protein